jgi:hypothetical protein
MNLKLLLSKIIKIKKIYLNVYCQDKWEMRRLFKIKIIVFFYKVYQII